MNGKIFAMKTAVILHGKPSKEGYFDMTRQSQSNSHWLPWLKQQLIVNGILAQTPELPEPYDPDYKKWKAVFEQFKIDGETILVGHSRGGGFLVRWLSEHKIKVGKVALVAPSLGNPDESPKTDFTILMLTKIFRREPTGSLSLFPQMTNHTFWTAQKN